MTATRTYRIVRDDKGFEYRIAFDAASTDTLGMWDITKLATGATYLVKHSTADNEWTCTCPDACKSKSGRRGLVRRNGCKHVNLVRCSIGDHKFLPALADGGQECVRCRVSIAQHEYETHGPPDEPMRPSRLDY